VLTTAYADRELESCWRMLSFAYGQASPLLMKCAAEVTDDDAFIMSENGLRRSPVLRSLFLGDARRVFPNRGPTAIGLLCIHRRQPRSGRIPSTTRLIRADAL
jgi:hypothetical protein